MEHQEKRARKFNGFLMLLVLLVLVFVNLIIFAMGIDTPMLLIIAIPLGLFLLISLGGFVLIQPNDTRVLTFFGKYIGTVKENGFYWVNPLSSKQRVTLKINNFTSDKLKVNDSDGNPILIGAVVVWRVVDTTRALFDVDNYHHFVELQSETAIRLLASRYPYDSHSDDIASLRSMPDEVTEELKKHLQERMNQAGVEIIESRISHLAYAPEIAQAMLRRQQAQAVIAARQQIVEGAMGMVALALSHLEESGVVELDEERKASMANNLLVALVSDNDAQPIINTGSLYS